VSFVGDRYVLVEALMPGDRVMTLTELVDVLTAQGRLSGQDDRRKWVSDLLRTELRRGRVVRVGRGRYRLGTMPPSTYRYIRRRARGLPTHRTPHR
jgi:hypothetical protein